MSNDPQINFAGLDERTGFRLERLEVFNWGTFDKHVHVLAVDGYTSLLTGANGGGKSTLVDAFLTLLVPQRLARNYNMASGSEKRKRSERTYVTGVWDEELVSADTTAVEFKKLRPDDGTPTVLLAVFRNRASHEFLSIAQVLWMANDEVQHVYVCTSDDRSIAKDFLNLGEPAKMRATLAKRHMDVFPTFDAYAETFCKRLHLAYPEGLALFNQVVAVKTTGDVASFVREHMLPRLTTIEETMASAHQQLEDLERCAKDIATAKRQLELLKPVADKHAEVAKARAGVQELSALHDQIPLFFAATVVRQGEARLLDIGREEESLQARIAALQAQKVDATAKRDIAIQAIAGLPEAQVLAQIKLKFDDAKGRKDEKEAARKRFDVAMREAELRDSVRTAADFKALQDRIRSKRDTYHGQWEDAIARATSLRQQAADKKREHDERFQQLVALRASRSHIHGDLLKLRGELSRETGIPLARLPFAGELIEVKPEFAKQWRETLEILLRNFARSLLVGDQDYRAVVDYLHGHNIRGRLDFNRMELLPASLAKPKAGDGAVGEPPRVITRLNIRGDHPLCGSVAEEIRRRFPHVCCESTAEFRQHEFAITSTRLIRNGPVRHTKDDRPQSCDPENFVLGWDNTELVRTIEERAAATAEAERKLNEQVARIEQNKQTASEHLAALEVLSRFESFEQISAAIEAQQMLEFERQRADLAKGNERLRALEAQRTRADETLAKIDADLTETNSTRGGLGTEKKRLAADVARRRDEIKGQEFSPESIGPRLKPYFGKETLTLVNADGLQSTVSNSVYLALSNLKTAADRLARELTSRMADFLLNFPEFRSDFEAKEDKVNDFLALQKRVAEEKLPELEERFRRLMRERVVQDMALLRNKLYDSVENYKTIVQTLNATLREIEYNAGTYIELVARDSRAAQILQFKTDLKACLPGAVNPTDASQHAAFEKIREVLGRLRTDEHWRRFVTDTRNWLDFVALENRRSDGSNVITYATTGSRSGGQQAKLAFSVMAAAIAHHYGLLRASAETRSFRFVVVDEIFGKTDEANSTYALKLFQKFKLQLLVVCPFTAQARVVDPFVGSYHLATNPDRNSSRVFRASLEEVQAAARS